ncbi:MAG: aminotransferase class III-fold pyridoxal phosphate-dependent enzyme [Deltaproteobacteria bacterium]|nr:aminotransferase class III-fold pyridoxal phosphate-dependent enzyme [Deltaproteobacteria bacterium]
MPLLETTPGFSPKDAVGFIKDIYGIRTGVAPLPGERDQNFLVEAESGERFIFKIANATEDRTMLEAQHQALAHLSRHNALCPRVIPAKTGGLINTVTSSSGTAHLVRMLSYLPGIPMGKVKRHSNVLLQGLGQCVGHFDRALADFDHPAACRDFHWDLAKALATVNKHKSLITDEQLRHLIDKCVADFERNVVPLFPRLRKSVIHNDANDFNVITGNGEDVYDRHQQIMGIIDFGDMVFSYTVCDLAIAIAYAILDKPDPLDAAVQIVRGYHGEYPLTDDEITALFGFVCMRLCVSACIAAHQQRQRPDDEYLSISQKPIRNTLPKLARVFPGFAEAAFRHACKREPVPHAESVCNWLRQGANTMAPVMGVDLSAAPCVVFDLSVGSPLISGDPNANTEPLMTKQLFDRMKSAGAQIGIGRYDEARLFYASPLFRSGNGLTDENRTIHLGVDLYAEPGTPVFAPMDGTVHAFANNDTSGDYGPVIILQHQTDHDDTFYTLYGHLGVSALDNLKPGNSFEKGEQIGCIGSPDVNGGWTPHLHFQIITDLLDLGCDFPGVCHASQRHIWRSFSPDPNSVLNIPDHRFPEPKTSKAENLLIRKKHIGRNLSIGYRDPLKIERGWMQYLFDETGRKYLDAFNNVPHVGHCHPHIIETARQQMAVLNTNTRYLHDFITRYAQRLCATMPDPLSVCFFVNSASEGNELALRLARAHTGQRDMIVLEGAYHGHTTTLIDISPYKHDGPGGTGAPPWVHTAPVADVYRGPYKKDDPRAAEKYARHVSEIIEKLQQKGIAPAGFIAETCPSVGGQIFFPDGYLAHTYKYVREAGGVCIADEVQTGYGRIGTHFYAFEAQDVVPDIVVLGKPIGNGHPISAVVTTPEIAASFDTGMEFFSTFGGNTVSCAVGLAVLDVVARENLQAHALNVGRHMLSGLHPFIDRYPIVGNVRGSGLFAGIELVRDRKTLEPAGSEASFVSDMMREHGILLGTDGPYHNVIKIRPPMPFSKSDADALVDTMDKILSDTFGK